jgi:glutamine synthetase
MNHDNLYEVSEKELRERRIGVLPCTLAEALDAFDQDLVVQAALGTTYATEYLRVKRDEWWLHTRNVSAWERDHYLATY